MRGMKVNGGENPQGRIIDRSRCLRMDLSMSRNSGTRKASAIPQIIIKKFKLTRCIDGELCLNRVKPEETLVEARSGSDVQIDRQIWV